LGKPSCGFPTPSRSVHYLSINASLGCLAGRGLASVKRGVWWCVTHQFFWSLIMKFKAFSRSVQGSGASRRLRRAGQVPAILYGGGAEAQAIALDHNQIFHDLNKDAFYASILEMELDNKKVSVLLRSVQWHPYKPQVMHVDFQRVRDDVEITTRVPLNFLNGEDSPAVRLHDQVISQLYNDLEITCLPADLPASIDVDLG